MAGTVFWLTGLSGAGKTTIGKALVKRLSENNATIFLDGDELREVTHHLFQHDKEQRLEASFLYARLCKLLAGQGFNVVCATISLFHETHAWNREHLSHYIEVFINTPLEVVMARDPKNIYARAREGQLTNVVGVDIPPDYPLQPHLTINNEDGNSIEAAVDRIMTFYQTGSHLSSIA